MPTSTHDSVAIGASDLTVFPLGLGTNTFNDPSASASFATILDGFVERGGNMIDTADMYSHWVPGNTGGESETVIGTWLAGRKRRDDVVIATKVSGKPDRMGLSPDNIRRSVDESLRRLQTDHIDLYYAHYEDPDTPVAASAEVFDDLVRDGKVRAVGLSNVSVPVIDEWFRLADEHGWARPVALQPEYSLVRRGYEVELAATAQRHGMSVFPYLVLAGGFLTGKYRTERDTEGRARAGTVGPLLTPEGLDVLDVLDAVAEAHHSDAASVALAWALAHPTVSAPLAAATSVAQLDALFAAVRLDLSDDQLASLNAASASFR